jgi:hypothetical protein
MPNRPKARKSTCPVCGRSKTVNALGRIAPHDVPKRRGKRCNGGGVKVAGMKMPTANKPHYINPN